MKQSEADTIDDMPASASERPGVGIPSTKYNEFANKHGFEDYGTMMNHAGSNAIVAHKIIDSLLAIIFEEEDEIVQGSGSERYTNHWDTGFAGQNDPYGIQQEYVSQSPNPNAALPTQAEADAVHNPAENGASAEPLV